MQLLKDKIEFEAQDFLYTQNKTGPYYLEWCQEWREYHKLHPETIEDPDEENDKSIQATAENLSKIYTTAINKKLSILSKNSKKSETLTRSIWIIGYLWEQTDPFNRVMSSFSWVPLKKITQRFVPYRGCGNIIIRDGDSEIQHFTQLIRVLEKLVEYELIDENKVVVDNDANPGKQKRNTFYRLSHDSGSASLSIEEKYDDVLDILEKSEFEDEETFLQLETALDLLKKLGIEDPEAEIETEMKKRGFDRDLYEKSRQVLLDEHRQRSGTLTHTFPRKPPHVRFDL